MSDQEARAYAVEQLELAGVALTDEERAAARLGRARGRRRLGALVDAPRRARRRPPRSVAVRALLCVLVALALCACGGKAGVETGATLAQRDVADRFAAAVLHGDAAGARALLVHRDEAALVFLVERAAAPWKIQHASIRPPVRRSGDRWTFSYVGRRTKPDGRFETERGDLVVFVTGAGVRFFVYAHVRRRFSTHHDAQLLPSNR